MDTTILVTGCAGFIGYHLSEKLLENDIRIIGIDNLNEYYDVNLKLNRLNKLKKFKNFEFYPYSLENIEWTQVLKKKNISIVINLAAQAGVRYSLENPQAYINSNIVGFMNILEFSRNNKIKHLVYASSSSVYGANKKVPFSTIDNVDYPVSLYAATKKSNELMAHTYSHLYDLPTTGLRFFTVYGPMGRPDMAYYSFSKSIMNDVPLKVFNYGKMKRDFTYIDDIVEGIIRIIEYIPTRTSNIKDNNKLFHTDAPYRIFNIGNNNPQELIFMISTLEKLLKKEAIKEFLPLQPGDVLETYADIHDLEESINFKPKTSLEDGLEKFVFWFKKYYNYI